MYSCWLELAPFVPASAMRSFKPIQHLEHHTPASNSEGKSIFCSDNIIMYIRPCPVCMFSDFDLRGGALVNCAPPTARGALALPACCTIAAWSAAECAAGSDGIRNTNNVIEHLYLIVIRIVVIIVILIVNTIVILIVKLIVCIFVRGV